MLDKQSGEFTQAKGQEVMESFLKSYDDIDVVICENDNEAFGLSLIHIYSFLEDSWYAEKDANVASMVAYIKGAFAKVSPSILHSDIVAGQVINACLLYTSVPAQIPSAPPNPLSRIFTNI